MSMLRSLIRFSIALLALSCIAVGVAAAQQDASAPGAPDAQARFAFVIGADGYDGAPLPTAANDAALVADALKAARFDVTGARKVERAPIAPSRRRSPGSPTRRRPATVCR